MNDHPLAPNVLMNSVRISNYPSYKASMPKKPRAAPNPAPIATVGPDAPPVETATLALALLLPLALSVALFTDTVLLFAAVGTTDEESIMEVIAGVLPESVADGVAEGVADASAEPGYRTGRRLLTSEGRAWYHVGVLPAESEDAISAAKADELASA